ncbi:hypothetical protein SLE2022_393070 [Rubroshorea leprosula]
MIRASATATAAAVIPYLSSPVFHSRLSSYPFLSKWVAPFQGPLFLSSPPWKLSQSATPLWGNGIVFRRVQALNLDLIRGRTGFPAKIEFGSVVSNYGVLGGVLAKEEGVRAREGFVESFVNLPNLISISRLVSGPFLGWMITNEMYSSAFVGLILSGAADSLDGYTARKMKINSVVGSYLDPLADKVLIGCVALAMVHNNLLHHKYPGFLRVFCYCFLCCKAGLVGIIVLRDIALIGGAAYLRASSLGWQWRSWFDFINLDGTHLQKVEPLFISKVNTVFQLALVVAALLQPEFGTPETQSYITYLSWLVATTTVASTFAYGAQNMRRLASITRKS